jgi:phage terminase large subunit GpA-like protein
LTVSQWADKYRQLSPESSGEHGQWYTSRAEFLRDIMDCVNRPEVEEVTLMKSAQTAGTEGLLNIIAYFMDQDPSPILVIEPDKDLARDFSMRRLAPMIRDTDRLSSKVIQLEKKRDNMFEKNYLGGILAIAWATSSAQLASRPIRILAGNDIDRFKASVGRDARAMEGSPYELARKRTQTFWNRKIFMNSTPTTRTISKIEELFFNSNQQHYEVPCPRCGFFQKLIFGPRSQFANLAKGMLVYEYDGSKVTDARYKCGNCSKEIPENERFRMIRAGRWKAQFPDRIKHQGFHINELYSPWSSWTAIAEEWEKKKGRNETLRSFINLTLGETFAEDMTELPTGDKFLDRREEYDAQSMPLGIIFLTASVDVQDDRLECYVEGWGLEEENWELDHYVAEGDPSKKSTWDLMENWLLNHEWQFVNGYKTKFGQTGGLMAVGVDTRGHHTKEAYKFCKRLKKKRFFALAGVAGWGKPIIAETKSKKVPVRLTLVGVDSAKQRIYDRLQQEKLGPGYQHFNKRVGKDYFDQLLSETKTVKDVRGIKTIVWKLIDVNRRNEALDCKGYNMAVFYKLNANMLAFQRELHDRMKAAGVDLTPESISPPLAKEGEGGFEQESTTQPVARKKRRRLIVRSSLTRNLRGR